MFYEDTNEAGSNPNSTAVNILRKRRREGGREGEGGRKRRREGGREGEEREREVGNGNFKNHTFLPSHH